MTETPNLPPPPKRDLQRIASAPTFSTPSDVTGPQFGPAPLMPPRGLQNKVVRPLMDFGNDQILCRESEPTVDRTVQGSTSMASSGRSTSFAQPLGQGSQLLPPPPPPGSRFFVLDSCCKVLDC